jgi:hyperosmotically inducible protein
MKASAFVLLFALMTVAWQTASAQPPVERITKEVHHELALLPYYGVFDFLAYKVSADGTVTLLGQVTQPTLKSDAGNAVKHVEGVEHVDNQIQVLPLSPLDDQIRHVAFRAIYGSPQLTKYAWQSVQSIHILVANGHITLEGIVDSQADKEVAEIRAKTVPNAFSVDDHLIVAGGK